MDDTFRTLLQQNMTDEKYQRLCDVKDSLKIDRTDALWSILAALDYYQELYEKMPQKISESAKDTLARMKETSEAQLSSQIEENKEKLLSTLSGAVNEVSRLAAKKAFWLAASICLGVSFLVLVGVSVLAFEYGKETGFTSGLLEASTQEARVHFANTPEGIIGYEMAKVGSLRDLALCNRPGWKKEGNVCYPYRQKNKELSGWMVP